MKKIDYVRKKTECAGLYELLREISDSGKEVVQEIELTQEELDRFEDFRESSNEISSIKKFSGGLGSRIRTIYILGIDFGVDTIKLCVCQKDNGNDGSVLHFYPTIKYTVVKED